MSLDYVIEKNLSDGEELLDFCWSGALDRVKDLSPEQRDALVDHLSEIFGDQEKVTDTQINDYIWFEDDYWMEAIGAPTEKEIVEEMIEVRMDEFAQKIADTLKTLGEEKIETLKEEYENGEDIPEDIVDMMSSFLENEAKVAIKERKEEEGVRESEQSEIDEVIADNIDEIFDAVFQAL